MILICGNLLGIPEAGALTNEPIADGVVQGAVASKRRPGSGPAQRPV
jgi:hypothetical protein